MSTKAGKMFADQGARGYNVAVMSTFARKEHFEHYDTQCVAQKELEAFAGSVHQGNLMIYFQFVLPTSSHSAGPESSLYS